ncbi:MAG TPA: amino acid ABC transporter permease [Segeticoccus sp.]|nr:amino acid ABC transporter permease [Segeticoccus sp.]
MSSVLFDVPGPRARARHRLWSIVGGFVVLLVLAAVIWKLWTEEAIVPEKWAFLTDGDIVWDLFVGLLSTLFAAAVAIAGAVVFGVVFAAGRLSERVWLRTPAVAVVEFFRATPLLLLMFFLFIAYGYAIGEAFGALVISLILYNGSVLAEIFRAGVKAVPRGQSEAAYAIGMRKSQVMLLVLVPQAVRTMLPALVSQCVVCLKDTALGYTIGYVALLRVGKSIFVDFTNNNPIAVGLVVAAVFIVICYSLSRLAVHLEERQRRQGRQPVAREGEPGAVADAG